MKSFRLISNILIIILLVFTSCNDDTAADLMNRKYVRIDKMDVSLTKGEKMILNAKVDSLSNINKTFKWEIVDESIASIETRDNQTAVITAITEGSTLIKIESTDGELKYFSDLKVAGDKVVKILAIGNSFSEDAIENYLYDLAKTGGHRVAIGNMYIGGCDLKRHWENAEGNKAEYSLRTISPDGNKASINNARLLQVIAGENWDYISFQEVSQLSGQIEGYQEYLPKLVEYAEALTTNPDVKFVLHQTWAYAKDSNHDGFANYDKDQMKMYNAILDAVWTAKDMAQIDMVIPSGTAIQNGRTTYIGDKFTRDGYHLSLSTGRFLAASTWYETIFGNIQNNTFVPSNFSEYDTKLVKASASEAVKEPKAVTEMINYKYPEPNNFVLNKPIYVDFGPDFTGGEFNNFRHPNDTKLSNLKDNKGVNSNFAIEVSKPFGGTISRDIQNILGFPATVSKDMFFSDGKFIPESGLILSNLNRDQKYTLVFYGSINDHGTQTEFKAVGKTEGVGYLDNDNNIGKLVVIKDIEPASDATINIQIKPGPDNIHFNKFFGINAMIIYPEGMEYERQPNNIKLEYPIYIDFGKRLSPLPFYNITEPSNNPIYNLPDALGNNTGISYSQTGRFNGENQSGATTNTLGIPSEVSADAFWSDRSNPTSGFSLYNLNTTMKYQFVFYGSRDGVGDVRETKYTVVGANQGSGAHNASSNKSIVTIVDGIQPSSDGTIDIILSPGSNNNNGSAFFYINSMIVTPEGYVIPGI